MLNQIAKTTDNPFGLPRTEIASLLEEMASVISRTEDLASSLSAKLENITTVSLPDAAIGTNYGQPTYRIVMGGQIGMMTERLRMANNRPNDLQHQIEL